MFCPYAERDGKVAKTEGKVPGLGLVADGRGDMFSEEKKEVK
jgi:hypothetical protein